MIKEKTPTTTKIVMSFLLSSMTSFLFGLTLTKLSIPNIEKKVLLIIISLLALTIWGFSSYLTFKFIQESVKENNVNKYG
jgi:hypothetical protein